MCPAWDRIPRQRLDGTSFIFNLASNGRVVPYTHMDSHLPRGPGQRQKGEELGDDQPAFLLDLIQEPHLEPGSGDWFMKRCSSEHPSCHGQDLITSQG